jgi:UDP-N-acetyl-D-mannosaminuronic acid transferase (WecB/TagA/CpsF family)
MTLTAVTDTQYQYIGDRGYDGTIVIKTSTEKLAFYGGTPMTRTTFANAAVDTTVAVSTSTTVTGWGYSTSTQANAIVSMVNEMRALLVALGLAG